MRWKVYQPWQWWMVSHRLLIILYTHTYTSTHEHTGCHCTGDWIYKCLNQSEAKHNEKEMLSIWGLSREMNRAGQSPHGGETHAWSLGSRNKYQNIMINSCVCFDASNIKLNDTFVNWCEETRTEMEKSYSCKMAVNSYFFLLQVFKPKKKKNTYIHYCFIHTSYWDKYTQKPT